MSGWPTPVADAALARARYVPPRVDEWLRGMETRVRSLHARLTQAVTADDPLPLLVEALEAAGRFLDEDHSTSLPRLLRRPLHQLALHGPSAVAYNAYVRRLLERGERAIELQAGVAALRGEMETVRARFEPLLPYHTAAELARARLGPEVLRAARWPQDLRPARKRLQTADRELRALAEQVPPDAGREPLAGAGAPAPTPAELRAALELRGRERAAARAAHGDGDALRRLAARHLGEVARAARRGAPASRHAHVLAELLARVSLRPGEDTASAGEDVGVWGGLLAAAGRALNGGAGEGWIAQVGVPDGAEEAEEDGPATVIYAVPIDASYVWLGTELASPVRVWSRGIRPGDEVECRVFPAAAPETAESAALDLAPLFDGVDASQPGWYATGQGAYLRVLAREGAGWIALLERRGTLRRQRTPAWRDDAGAAPAVRVLARAGQGVGAADVGPTTAAPTEFLGRRTREVRTPFAGHPLGWIREPADAESAASLWREYDLFSTLAMETARSGLLPLGRARVPDRADLFPVYARPFALRRCDAPPVGAWLESDGRAAFMRAIARVVATVHAAGFAVGVHHPDALAYSVEWEARTGAPRPRAVLVEAPCAAPFGERFRPPSESAASLMEYPRLRFRGVSPVIRLGDTASPAADLLGFGLLLLELLAERPLPHRGWLSWEEIAPAVERHAETCFARPRMAVTVASCLESVARAEALFPLFHKLAADTIEAAELSAE